MFIESILIMLIFVVILLIFAKIWKKFRDFHHKNDTYMDFVFIVLYYIEQFLFLVLYYSDITHRELWVGLIVLSVATTASLDKLMMYSRHKYLQEIISSNLVEKIDLLNTISLFEKENKELKSDNKFMEKILGKGL